MSWEEMDIEDNVHANALAPQMSSSVIRIPEENDDVNDTSLGQKRSQDLFNLKLKEELVYSSPSTERKLVPSKSKVRDYSKATGGKGQKNLEVKKQSSSQLSLVNTQVPSKNQQQKIEYPTRLISDFDVSAANGVSKSWICKNSACKAILSLDDTFCKRCSCCVCHLFDDNKDPSLWLVCSSEHDNRDYCGSSCHIDCALQCHRVGVVKIGQVMELDGSYCCASCGKVSGIIGFWKKQLAIAKDARRVDILCHRIFLSYRLLEGTSRFSEMHDIVKDAKAKLEIEVGPVNGVSAKMARGIVSRLSIAADVQKLCSLAIEKADQWLAQVSNTDCKDGGSCPAACRFQFEEITSSTLVIVLKDARCASSDPIEGYKLWYCKSNKQSYDQEPVVFPKAQRRILISNLLPCTEYSFKVISYTGNGDFGHSEAKCFTKSIEIILKNNENNGTEGCSSNAKRGAKNSNSRFSGFKVRNLGNILRQAWFQNEGSYDGFSRDDAEEESCYGSGALTPESVEEERAHQRVYRQLDLNVTSVPDLNAEATPTESSPDEDNGCTSEKNGLVRSNGSDSQTPECMKQEQSMLEDTCDGDSTLVNDSPLRFPQRSSHLDENYEYCVRIIRWLECSGYIERDFRMKFLTWFSLRSTWQERRVVMTFIQTLIEEPSSLAGQLLDSFTEIVNCKRPRSGFCSKLWH